MTGECDDLPSRFDYVMQAIAYDALSEAERATLPATAEEARKSRTDESRTPAKMLMAKP